MRPSNAFISRFLDNKPVPLGPLIDYLHSRHVKVRAFDMMNFLLAHTRSIADEKRKSKESKQK